MGEIYQAIQRGLNNRLTEERKARVETEVALSLSLAPKLTEFRRDLICQKLKTIQPSSCLDWASAIKQLEGS